MDYKLYTVEHEGKTVKLKSSQLNVQILSKIFGLFPNSILLLSDDGYVETADSDGRFHDVDDLSQWTVTGECMKPCQTVSAVPVSYSYQPPTAYRGRGKGKAKWTPRLNPLSTFHMHAPRTPPGVRTQEAMQSDDTDAAGPSSKAQPSEWRKNVEVCRWAGEDGWKKVSNLPIVIN